MKIDNYQVAFNSTHTNLGFDYRNMQTSNTKADFSDGKAAEVEQTDSLSPNTDFVDAKISRQLQRDILTRLSESRIQGASYNYTEVNAEYESLNFQTKAIIQAGGKEMSIDMDINLDRSFVETNQISLAINELHDPLIVTLDGEMPTLSDEKFSFDIDANGTEDQISVLGRNSGFLAFDKNENGKIDDGMELFGTQSGDGFRDLRGYDDDGNGWIDENDKIFDKLQIWQKSENSSRLVGLGEVGIGAIFLGNTQTSFSLKSLEDNSLNGQIKSSSFVLFENGSMSVISQVDLAVEKEPDKKLENLTNVRDFLKTVSENSLATANQLKSSYNSDEEEEESPIDKIKAKISSLETKLLSTKNESKQGTIRAQIAGLQAQLMALLSASMSSYA